MTRGAELAPTPTPPPHSTFAAKPSLRSRRCSLGVARVALSSPTRSMVVPAGRSSLRGGGETPPRPREAAGGASLGARAMETLRRSLIVGALLGAGAGVGSALFVLVSPGEQQKQAMLKVGAGRVRGALGGRRAGAGAWQW